jgi:hypothetical protein
MHLRHGTDSVLCNRFNSRRHLSRRPSTNSSKDNRLLMVPRISHPTFRVLFPKGLLGDRVVLRAVLAGVYRIDLVPRVAFQVAQVVLARSRDLRMGCPLLVHHQAGMALDRGSINHMAPSPLICPSVRLDNLP